MDKKNNVTLEAMFRSLITTQGTIAVQCRTLVSLVCKMDVVIFLYSLAMQKYG